MTVHPFLESDKTFFSIVLEFGKRIDLWSMLGFTLPPFQIFGNVLIVTMSAKEKNRKIVAIRVIIRMENNVNTKLIGSLKV